MIKYLFIIASALAVSACGGGGGGGSPPSTNSSGFPDVAGRYPLNTSSFNVSCSDGSAGTNPPIALNLDVTQSVNAIRLTNTSSGGGAPSITIIESTSMTGNVETNASFITNQHATANLDGISGIVRLNYNITGNFSSNGWSGTYKYTASSSSLGTCTYTASFSGTKITAAKADLASKQINDNYGLPVDFYDQFSIIGSNVAINK